jgi:hypothetical protein
VARWDAILRPEQRRSGQDAGPLPLLRRQLQRHRDRRRYMPLPRHRDRARMDHIRGAPLAACGTLTSRAGISASSSSRPLRYPDPATLRDRVTECVPEPANALTLTAVPTSERLPSSPSSLPPYLLGLLRSRLLQTSQAQRRLPQLVDTRAREPPSARGGRGWSACAPYADIPGRARLMLHVEVASSTSVTATSWLLCWAGSVRCLLPTATAAPPARPHRQGCRPAPTRRPGSGWQTARSGRPAC